MPRRKKRTETATPAKSVTFAASSVRNLSTSIEAMVREDLAARVCQHIDDDIMESVGATEADRIHVSAAEWRPTINSQRMWEEFSRYQFYPSFTAPSFIMRGSA